jgi:hypothetical protein
VPSGRFVVSDDQSLAVYGAAAIGAAADEIVPITICVGVLLE